MLHWLHLTFCQADQLQQNPQAATSGCAFPNAGAGTMFDPVSWSAWRAWP